MLPTKPAKRPLLFTVCLIAAGIAGNMVFSFVFTKVLGIPLFMDTIMTIAVTFYAGLVPGLLTGILYNLVASVSLFRIGPQAIFALCSAATVLIIYFCRQNRKGEWPWFDLLVLSLHVGFANSILGGIISTFAFGGVDHFLSDYIIAGILMQGLPLAGAAILARIPMNIIDKCIAVFAGYGMSLLIANVFPPAGEKD